MSRACAAVSDFHLSNEESSSSEDDEKVKCNKGDFTGLCLMGKSSRNASDSDCVVSDDLSFESLFLRVVEPEIALCNQDKLLCRVFCENKNLNLKLENSFAEIASLRLMHDDMNAKPCDNCKMIMVNYADLWIVHTQISSQRKGAKSELRELKARSLLLGVCTTCPMLIWRLVLLRLKKLSTKLIILLASVLSPSCEICGSLRGKLFHATKENTELK
jgi:hypothetical protein